ncbi:MAG: FAD/NAD(P)-binding protein [Microbacterium sp.]
MTARIGIVGGGPRGLSLVERIVAGLARSRERAEIVLFEPGTPGAGRIWRPDQPRELLMNTRAGEVTIFADATVPVRLPLREGPTLLEWAHAVVGQEPWRAEWAWLGRPSTDDLASEQREECRGLNRMAFVTRGLYGAYLAWAYRRVVAALPAHVAVRHLPHRVNDVREDAVGVDILDADGGTTRADAVVLALGWLDAEHDRPVRDSWIGPDNPLDQPLSGIRPGERVLLTGLGMSVFDNIARLTEGRGGTFAVRADGSLAYRQGEREPRLLVGSASGRPYWPKPELDAPAAPQDRRRLEAVLARDELLDFDRDIWPALVADAAAEYLRILAGQRPGAIAPDADVETALDALANRDEDVLDGLGDLALAVLRDPADGLRADDLTGRMPPASGGAAWLRERYDAMLSEAERGDESPLVRALTSLAGARAPLATAIAAGRVSAATLGDGYRWYHAFAPRLGGGPPALRIRQLLALIDAGVVELLGPGVRAVPVPDGDGYAVRDADGTHGTVSHVVESWMHRPTLRRTADPLLRALRDRGAATAFVARDATGEAVTGALHVDPSDGAVIGAIGVPSRAIRSVGIPSDGQIGHSVISPVPRAASRFLRETDAAAQGTLETVLSHAALSEGDAP